MKPEAGTLAPVGNIGKVWTSFYLWSLLLWGRESALQSGLGACFRKPGSEGEAGAQVCLEVFCWRHFTTSLKLKVMGSLHKAQIVPVSKTKQNKTPEPQKSPGRED